MYKKGHPQEVLAEKEKEIVGSLEELRAKKETADKKEAWKVRESVLCKLTLVLTLCVM